MNRTIRIQRLVPKDRDLWQALYYRHQQQSRRRRLLALKAIWDGASMAEVCRSQRVRRKILEAWLDSYLHGGFDALLAPQKRPRPQALTPQRRKILRYILLHKVPADYGIDRYQWTAPHVMELLRSQWNVALRPTRRYEIFDELGLSHQKAHRDYGPARPRQRAEFVRTLEKKPIRLPRTPPSSPSTSSP